MHGQQRYIPDPELRGLEDGERAKGLEHRELRDRHRQNLISLEKARKELEAEEATVLRRQIENSDETDPLRSELQIEKGIMQRKSRSHYFGAAHQLTAEINAKLHKDTEFALQHSRLLGKIEANKIEHESSAKKADDHDKKCQEHENKAASYEKELMKRNRQRLLEARQPNLRS